MSALPNLHYLHLPKVVEIDLNPHLHKTNSMETTPKHSKFAGDGSQTKRGPLKLLQARDMMMSTK